MTCTDQEKSWYNSFKTTPKFDIKGCCLLMRDISIDYRTRMMSMIPHAVQNNHLNCLKIIVKQGLIVPNNGEIIRLAMALGHLDIVKYLIESVYKGGNINNEIHGPETFFFILRHLSFLKTVHRRKCKLDANKIVLMVCHGAVLHDDCVISMHEQNCSWRDDRWMESYASKNRYLGIARIISPFNNSRIWTTKLLIIDARMDNLVTSQRAVCDPVMDLIDRIV